MNKYEDIINNGRPISNRPKISLNDRAAQFAPFSALTGYEDKVIEASRLTDYERIIDEDKKEILSKKLNLVFKEKVETEFIFFVKDVKKDGGKYSSVKGIVKKIDNVNKKIILDNKKELNIWDIIEIKSNFFD